MGCQNAKAIGPSENLDETSHVMISYSWKFRTQIPTQIYDELAKRNYRMWMDRKMGINSNMNRDMAHAVENASIVMPFLCRDYERSENCEKELSYADAKNKSVIPILIEPDYKPSGWLALVISRFKYIDISQTGVTSEKLDEIVQVIESFFNKKTTLQTANKVITTTGRSIVRSGELEFEKGEIFIVLTDDGPWLNVQSEQTGEIGLIPENYCVPVNSITAMPWYCVGDRELSERLLHNDGRDGAFVVRPSAASASGDKVKPFVLSLHRDGRTFHYAVMKAGNMFHLETLPNMFDSMSELVEFYKHHPITKIKPSRHEIEILTGRKFTGKRSSFLGVEDDTDDLLVDLLLVDAADPDRGELRKLDSGYHNLPAL